MNRRSPAAPRYGLARVLSKQGLCSRTEAARWIAEGRVRVDGKVVRDPEFPVQREHQRVEVDGHPQVDSAERVFLMLNKPRGLVTSTRDEQGRDTVYRCLADASLPWLAPVGRLDKASEGLLLFSNHPQWAAHITSPDSGPLKTYHVQIDCIPDPAILSMMTRGVACDGEQLAAQSVCLLRSGGKNAWLQVVLDEGRNRQIRRLLGAFDIGVLRLLRVAIGPLQLGNLTKGKWRRLTLEEAASLAPLD